MKLSVMAPEGMSTGGGKMARQSLSLHPPDNPTGGIMIGWLDVAQKLAAHRPYDNVCKLFEARHKKAFPITKPDFLELVNSLATILKSANFDLTVESARLPGPTSTENNVDQADIPKSNTGIFIAAAVLIAVGVAAAIFLTR